jgi:hypothetical protein
LRRAAAAGVPGWALPALGTPTRRRRPVSTPATAANRHQPPPTAALQVCDDSTREAVRKKVDAAVISALEKGHNVQLVRRDNRSGFKAGAMVDGMKRVEDQGFEYVAIFDADFEPPEDFFYQTVVHMMRDDNLAFVQTRWTFTNSNSLLTWAQKVGLEFHFAVEQRARSFLGQFFNFNGTAGVWRIKAINDAGGWESDTGGRRRRGFWGRLTVRRVGGARGAALGAAVALSVRGPKAIGVAAGWAAAVCPACCCGFQ